MILQRIGLSLSLLQKKRVTISDYSLVERTEKISNPITESLAQFSKLIDS